ncbi:Rv3235 family protein [Streptomyces sp. DH24]|uniref:Rv3235 family protein n=1 Tax=Streptomyces sp. DH24 TaxID=3040123 RepID=UPI002442D50D|nr:Rv3235 family protein [Streptomyces sp. DH24]MDG9720294.1 Rv3235 family protein [Streptomyces sp. DH24]
MIKVMTRSRRRPPTRPPGRPDARRPAGPPPRTPGGGTAPTAAPDDRPPGNPRGPAPRPTDTRPPTTTAGTRPPATAGTTRRPASRPGATVTETRPPAAVTGAHHPAPATAPGRPAVVPAQTPRRPVSQPRPTDVFADRLLAVLSGRRPVHWMLRHTTGPAYDELIRLAERRPLRTRGPGAVVRDIGYFEPRPGAIEAFARIGAGDRLRAMAFRLEQGRDLRWRCTAVELGGPRPPRATDD